MLKFSVILVTYNSTFKSIMMSLESVIYQKNIDFELIITDDASKYDYFKEIDRHLLSKNFFNYKFIKHKENIGTVNNLLNACKMARGYYIKAIGAGDMLYNETVLKDIYQFMMSNKVKCLFGQMDRYYFNKSDLVTSDFNCPTILWAYRKQSITRKIVLINMLMDNIWASGASMFFEKSLLVQYLGKIKNNIKYVEDLIQILIYLDGMQMTYYERKVVWYEYGSGISTSGKKTNRLVKNDIDSFYKYITSEYKKNIIVKMAFRHRQGKAYEYRNFLWMSLNKKIEIILSKKSIAHRKKGFLTNNKFLSNLPSLE
ncbi:MAG: glycosyltransferase [Anaerocolumna sp.]